MALPPNGSLTIGQIVNEVGVNSYSLRELSSVTGKSTPDAMSEFYSFALPDGSVGVNGAYKYGYPQLIFDFSISASYSNSGTSIADLSGNGNNGTFSTGTGNGTATTVSGYNTGYLSLPGTSSQLSVRIPDSLKPSGNNPFTFVVRMKPKGYSYNGNYPGILSHGSDVIGLSWYLDGVDTRQACWRDINCGSNGFTSLTYANAGGAGINTWATYYFTSNGYNQRLHVYYGGNLYSSTSVATSCGITVSSDWGFFLGLRYNQWINADINYTAIYNKELTTVALQKIGAALAGRTPS